MSQNIRFRANSIAGKDTFMEFKENEVVSELVCRCLDVNYDGKIIVTDNIFSYFTVVMNGHVLDYEYWDLVTITESDVILIAPKLQGGDFGQIFKQVAIIVVAVVASVYVGPGAGGGIVGGLAAAATTVGATLLLNSLIPPPSAGGGLGGIGGSETSINDSSMYSISGQTNRTNRYGSVPKVYGTHRVFPNVAANPYTSLSVEDDTGVIVQYFYAIYDFGYGPITVSDIKIGDTPISEYANVSYRLVDTNKPLADEGIWDSVTFNSFEIYKGTVETDGTVVTINSDESPSLPVSEYSFIRNAAPNPLGHSQEIDMSFTCPKGLIAYGTDGSTSTRTIELSIEFSKVGEDVWRGYDDLDYVDFFSYVGGSESNRKSKVEVYFDGVDTSDFDIYSQGTFDFEEAIPGGGIGAVNRVVWDITEYKLKNINKVKMTSGVLVGSTLRTIYPYNILGKIVSEIPIGGGFSEYTLDRNIEGDVRVMSYIDDGTNQEFRPNYGDYFILEVEGSLNNGMDIVGRTNKQVYASVIFKPKTTDQIKIRVTRKNSFSANSFSILDELTMYSLNTRFDTTPITTDKRHTFLEIRIKATNQLNGAINNLSAVCSSVLDTWDGVSWTKKQTSNPAWVFADLLTGEVNPKAIDKTRLDTASLLEWANYCDEIPAPPVGMTYGHKRFTSNFVLDYGVTLQGVLGQVSNAAQASLNMIDGKYGVLIDIKRTIPVQVFTPRNSWNFKSNRNYADTPHKLKVRYVDPALNWQVSEMPVYDDGYDENTFETGDELSTFACTSSEQAWRFGRYMLAQNRLRQESISIEVDFEHLVCTRGDYVIFTQDVMKVGGRPARVKSITANQIVIDDAIETIPVSYGYTFRSSIGEMETSTLTVISDDTFDLDGDLPSVGDLIIIGEVGKLHIDCIVKSIEPSSDLNATLHLIEKADAVYDSETLGTFPPYNPQLNTSTEGNAAPNPVEDLEIIANTWEVIGRNYQYYITTDWEVPNGSAVSSYEVYVNYGTGYDLVDVTKETLYKYIVDQDNLNIEHCFKVLAVSATGEKKTLLESPTVCATPEKKVTSPSDVDALYLNITNEVLQLDWFAVPDADIDEYLIRYSPLTSGALWESSIPLMRVDRNTTLASTQARTGTYFIKALDFNQNESDIAAQAITNIPELFNLNIIETIDDFPSLGGEKVRTVLEGAALLLQNKTVGGVTSNEYYSDGYYYYTDFLDLGEIYTVRLQSLIQAEGYTISDLMSNWATLSDVLQMSSSKFSEWDVEAQVRYTDTFNVMADWTTLSDVDPISEGVQDNWTNWFKFTTGDFTGRIFQFRLRLVSNKASVTPRVITGTIKADMPDRVWTSENIVSNAVGVTTVYYTPAFKGPLTSPNIQITQDNAQQGDYYILSGKTLSKFDITFYDKDNNQVSRQFDVNAKGYGRKANTVI